MKNLLRTGLFVLFCITFILPASVSGKKGHDDQPKAKDRNSRQAVKVVRQEFGLGKIAISFPQREVKRQSRMYPGTISFSTAVHEALMTWFTDFSQPDSPLADGIYYVFGVVGSEDGGSHAWPPSENIIFLAQGVIRNWMNLDGTSIEIAQETLPECAFPDIIETHWIIQLRRAESDAGQWVFIDRSGVEPSRLCTFD